jgi:GrpB-like predicted nucleotidyltransferase (UPF0157 family)
VHLWTAGGEEERRLLFRDWLRANDVDRELYESVKRDLATRDWNEVQDYANAKSDVVAQIMRRAETASQK